MLVPVLAFVESCIGIGLFVSGVFLVVASSALYASGVASLGWIMGLAFAGAMLGDHTGYYAGRWIGPRLHHLRLAQRHRDKLDKAESLIRVSGAYAILIGRFVPAVRSLIPAALGISGFGRLHYSAVDATACLLWAGALGAITAGIAQL